MAADDVQWAVDALSRGLRTGDIKQPGCTLVGCRDVGHDVEEALRA